MELQAEPSQIEHELYEVRCSIDMIASMLTRARGHDAELDGCIDELMAALSPDWFRTATCTEVVKATQRLDQASRAANDHLRVQAEVLELRELVLRLQAEVRQHTMALQDLHAV